MIIEENNKIIIALEEDLEKICISEIEHDIMEGKEVSHLEKLLYDSNGKIDRYARRVFAINEKLMLQEKNIGARIEDVEQLGRMPCQIEFMDSPLNQSNYIAQSFYQELYQTYKNDIGKTIVCGLVSNMFGRRLQLQYMSEEEQKKARIITLYLKLCVITEQMERLLDCVKCIQANYTSVEKE